MTTKREHYRRDVLSTAATTPSFNLSRVNEVKAPPDEMERYVLSGQALGHVFGDPVFRCRRD
eukprot:CAMPEP_0172600332 /NCGR_PEP_ID=MMETSP1068-20121228/20505_1 /TAXON_ID=35684 /ORGANISM="Pseudopedinella elastica, Strain CCMP716" /LENGTH=61 /DNA_ID=CAMNT_0013400957 /DNA_START=296 /DNA_END=481 /DNA_ORIENTATION=+